MDSEIESVELNNYKATVKEFKIEIQLLKDENVVKSWSAGEIENKIKHFGLLIGQMHDNASKAKESLTLEDQNLLTSALEQADKLFSQAMNKLDALKGRFQPDVSTSKQIPSSFDFGSPFADDISPPSESIESQPINISKDKKLMDAILGEIRSEFSRILNEQSQLTSTRADPFLGETKQAGSQSTLQMPYRVPLAQIDEEDSAPKPRKNSAELPIMQLHFDKVSLSTFSGDHTEWIPFRDEFNKYVHLNPNLSAVMKFHQLRTHLNGIALEAINGLTLSEADYEAAWSLLKERYDNERILISEYLKRFFDLPYLSSNPTTTQFLQMVNKTNQLIRVIPIYHYDVTSWDPILIFVLTSRLDSQSLRKWSDQIKKRQRIPLSELIEFLDVQAAERVACSTEPRRIEHKASAPKSKKSKQKKVNVMVTTKESKCIQCKSSDHPVYQCKTFLALEVKDRIKKIRQGKHCLRCFNTHSDKEECSFRNCKYCSQAHNNLLCYQHENELKKDKEHQSDDQNNPPPSSQ